MFPTNYSTIFLHVYIIKLCVLCACVYVLRVCKCVHCMGVRVYVYMCACMCVYCVGVCVHMHDLVTTNTG